MSGRASLKGDFLDHVLDRVSDVLILGGLMFSGWCRSDLAAVALVVTLLVSYMGTQAQAVGCGRIYGGIMGRTDRMVLVMVVALVQMAFSAFFPTGRLPGLYGGYPYSPAPAYPGYGGYYSLPPGMPAMACRFGQPSASA